MDRNANEPGGGLDNDQTADPGSTNPFVQNLLNQDLQQKLANVNQAEPRPAQDVDPSDIKPTHDSQTPANESGLRDDMDDPFSQESLSVLKEISASFNELRESSNLPEASGVSPVGANPVSPTPLPKQFGRDPYVANASSENPESYAPPPKTVEEILRSISGYQVEDDEENSGQSENVATVVPEVKEEPGVDLKKINPTDRVVASTNSAPTKPPMVVAIANSQATTKQVPVASQSKQQPNPIPTQWAGVELSEKVSIQSEPSANPIAVAEVSRLNEEPVLSTHSSTISSDQENAANGSQPSHSPTPLAETPEVARSPEVVVIPAPANNDAPAAIAAPTGPIVTKPLVTEALDSPYEITELDYDPDEVTFIRLESLDSQASEEIVRTYPVEPDEGASGEFSNREFDVRNFAIEDEVQEVSESPAPIRGALAEPTSASVAASADAREQASQAVNQAPSQQQEEAVDLVGGSKPDTGSQSDEGCFWADSGDVIYVDGDEGYGHIDLACFDFEDASFQNGRIYVCCEDGMAFQIEYKNVSHAVFADGVEIELP